MGNLEIKVIDTPRENGQRNGDCLDRSLEAEERETAPIPISIDHIQLKLLKLERHHQVFVQNNFLISFFL